MFQWESRLRQVSHWNGGPKDWDFPVPLSDCTLMIDSISHISNKIIFILYIWRDTMVYLWRRTAKYVTLEVTSDVLKLF